MVLLLLLACADCRLTFGDGRSRCRYDRVVAATDATMARSLALEVEDPIVRGAAVMTWVDAHGGAVRPADGRALCAVLGSSIEEGACERRLLAVHLQR